MGANAAPAAAIAAAIFGALAATMDQSTAAANIEAALDTLSTPANLLAQIVALIAASEALQGAIKAFTIRGSGATTAALPSTGSDGDIWIIGDEAYAWFSGRWNDIGPLKGDAGANAASDVTFSIVGSFGAGEKLASYRLPRDLTIAAAHLADGWWLAAPPAATKVFTINRNGAAWLTATFLAGQHTATVTATTTGLADGDVLDLYSSAPFDALAADLTASLPGA